MRAGPASCEPARAPGVQPASSRSVDRSVPAIAAVFPPVAAILAAIADVLTTITAILEPIAPAADVARVPPILAAIADVLPAIPAILAPVAHVLGPIADAVAVRPIGEGRRGQDGQRREERGRDEQADKAARSNHGGVSLTMLGSVVGLDTCWTGAAGSGLNRHDFAAVDR